MKIQTRIIGAAMLVVAIVNIVSAVYFINKERTNALAQLDATMEYSDRLLKVVAAGPLYDGNVEQLDTILDSLFAEPSIVNIELKEYNGSIRMYRTRTPQFEGGKSFTRRVEIMRRIDLLGEITTVYSSAGIEEHLRTSRGKILLFSTILVLGLSVVIYFVARGLTRPIERLSVAAREMASGHLDREIDVRGAEELQSLGLSFIRMRDAVREKMSDLAAQNEALRLMDQAMSSSINGIVIASPHGAITYVNGAFLRMWGYDRASDVLGRSTVDFWADTEKAAQAMAAVLSQGGSIGELMAKRRDGSLFPTAYSASLVRDGSDAITHLMGSFVDITDQKQAEDALRKSDERLQQVVRVSLIGIFDHDHITDTIYWSPQQRAHYGFSPEEEVTLQAFLACVHPDDRDRIQEAVRHAHDPSGDGMFDIEHRITRRDGAVRWISTRSQTFFEDHGGAPRPVRTVGATRDITESKADEEERQTLQAQLIQAQKMESVGRLAGGVAHDFNNMLAVILGYTDLAKKRVPDGDPLDPYLREIEAAAVRSRELTRQLLAFSRKQVIAPRIENLNNLIASLQSTLLRLIGEDIELRVIPAADLWNINIDPLQIDQIVMNLAVNARDAMPNGGKLTIETSNVHLDEDYCRRHSGFLPGSYVLLSTSDNGAGIDKDTLVHVFEPFFTTKESGMGTGLGLATVYGIVKQNHGFINVYSEVAEGTTVKIYLPRAASVAMPKQPAPLPIVPGSGTILLVEDDPMVRRLTAQMLEALGYSVIVSDSPAQALSLCAQAVTPIDLMMTDVVMPGMNGKELMQKAQAVRPGTKVLFMSGYTSNVIAHHGVLEEGIRFIQKPFSMEDLAQKVRDAIAKA